MKLAKVRSRVLSRALDSKKFFHLSCYLRDYLREEDCFISEVVTYENKPTLDIRLAMMDYCFNEHPESEKLFELANNLFGKSSIDLDTLKVVEL